jgi:hypothetical protein
VNLEDAFELEGRIRRERPDVMVKRVGWRDGYLLKVAPIDRRTLKRGHPHFIESEDEWLALRGDLKAG